VVLTKQVNPKCVARRAAAATRWLGAIESCLGGDRGRQRLERLGSGSSSAQHAQRGGSASAARGSQGHATCREPDGAPADGKRQKGSAEIRVNRSGHARIAPPTSRVPDSANCFWTGQAPTPGDDGDECDHEHALAARSLVYREDNRYLHTETTGLAPATNGGRSSTFGAHHGLRVDVEGKSSSNNAVLSPNITWLARAS